jgi:hypothetical protein
MSEFSPPVIERSVIEQSLGTAGNVLGFTICDQPETGVSGQVRAEFWVAQP